MSMEIKGTCVQVMQVETGMGKKGQWKKQSFILETKSQYPKKVCLQLWGDKVDSAPAVGDELTCSIDPESREYNGRWYTDIRVWKIEGFTGNMKARQGDDTFNEPSSLGGTPAHERVGKDTPTLDPSGVDDLPF